MLELTKKHISNLPLAAIWTDGSAMDFNTDGGSGAFIEFRDPEFESVTLRCPQEEVPLDQTTASAVIKKHASAKRWMVTCTPIENHLIRNWKRDSPNVKERCFTAESQRPLHSPGEIPSPVRLFEIATMPAL